MKKAEHFNRPLSPSKVTKTSSTAVVKWRAKVTVTFTMRNGGQATFETQPAIVIRRVDVERVHDYARDNCELRDYLFIRLPMKIGLRTGEITTLRIEYIDFNDRSFQVLDSKKKKLYPLPLDVLTLQLIRDLVAPRHEGYVFRHKKAWKNRCGDRPLTIEAVSIRVNQIASELGVAGFTPRLLRHYFAAHWVLVEHKNVELLRQILRHKNLEVTTRYIARLSFFEDLQREYQQTQNPYVAQQGVPRETSEFYREWCAKCDREPTCKYVDQVALCPWSSGCRYFVKKKEMIGKNVKT